jgi:hypothetical protein
MNLGSILSTARRSRIILDGQSNSQRRLLMRASLVSLVVILAATQLEAAPAPNTTRKAKEKLEALKKRLPDIVSSWAKERWYQTETVEVRVVRMLGPTQAKVVLLSQASDDQGGRKPYQDKVFTIFLDFYDGIWSSTRFDASWPATNHFENSSVRFLMLAIDEAGEK